MIMDERRAERLTSGIEIHSVRHGERRSHACSNISRLGCMIADEGLHASTGDDIEIELPGGASACARVIWARNGQVGLAFKREIDAATMRHIAQAENAHHADAGHRAKGSWLLPERFARRAA